jgi:hypothetical protein
VLYADATGRLTPRGLDRATLSMRLDQYSTILYHPLPDSWMWGMIAIVNGEWTVSGSI